MYLVGWGEEYSRNESGGLFAAGPIPLSTYMRIYKKGDIVDIKVSSLRVTDEFTHDLMFCVLGVNILIF